MESYGKKGVDTATLIENKIEEAKANGRSLSHDAAFEEVVADSMETMLTDHDISDKLTALKERDEGLFKKIAGFFRDFFEKIKSLYTRMNPNSEEGRMVREMKDTAEELSNLFADALADAGENYKAAAKNKIGAGMESIDAKYQQRYKEYNKPITVDDIKVLRSIGRKSINDFTSADIEKSQKWAYKFYKELGTKSPFFRAWFGDWRAHDKGFALYSKNIPLLKFKSQKEAVDYFEKGIKEKTLFRGDVKNIDSDFTINIGSLVYNDSLTYANRALSRSKNFDEYLVRLSLLNNVESIVKHSIYLDTETSHKDNDTKKNMYQSFYHYFYSLSKVDGDYYLVKLSVDELNSPNTTHRAYNVNDIKISPVAVSQVYKPAGTTNDSGEKLSTINISDLHSFVKQYDENFNPKPVNPVPLNKDGTPKVFYHGTDSTFTSFSPNEIASREGSYFFAENKEDAKAYGEHVMSVYLKGENLADYDNQPSEFYKLRDKREQVKWLKDRGYDGWYADMDSNGWGEVSVFSPEQIKSATDNIGTYDSENADIKYSVRYTTDNRPVAVIDDDILKNVPESQWIQTVKNTISGKFSGGIPISGRLIKVNKTTYGEYTHSKYSRHLKIKDATIYRDKFKAANHLDDIVLASTNYINEDLNHNRKDNIKEFARGDVLIRAGKNNYSAKVIVGFTSGKQMVLYDVIDFSQASFKIKKKRTSPSAMQNAGSQRRGISSSSSSIPQVKLSVNTQYTQNPVKDSNTGEKNQIRPVDTTSARYVLSQAVEDIALNEEEMRLVQKYQEQQSSLIENNNELNRIKREINSLKADAMEDGRLRLKKLTPEAKATIIELQKEANRLEIKVNRADRRLLQLEAMQPIRDVLEREKSHKKRQSSVEDCRFL